MNILEKHFEIALETPDGITRLRELILKFAMQGKLVPQNSDDINAKELLSKILEQKKDTEKRIKKNEKEEILEIAEFEIPYPVPQNWIWTRIDTVCNKVSDGFHHSAKKIDGGIKYISATHIFNGHIDWNSGLTVSLKDYDDLYKKTRQSYGDILIVNRGAGCGDAAIVDIETKFCFQNAAIIGFNQNLIYSKYVLYYLHSSRKQFLDKFKQGGAQPMLSNKLISTHLFPLAPLEEQKRIVEKIEQLMLLCDQLEKQRDTKNSLLSKINNASISKLIEANDEKSLSEAWLFIQHQFETIFADKKNVVDLKEVILNLAMRGKLATHNSSDTPASVLLKEIDKERKQLIKEKKISNQKELLTITASERKFNLPVGWEWIRLNDYGIWKSGSTPSRSNSSFYEGNIPWVKSGEVKQGKIKHTSETITELALEKCSLHINPIGSVLIAMYGANIGETGVLEIEAATNQAVCACKTYSVIDNQFLHKLLQSLKSNFISQGAGAAQPNISREKIINTVVPLPPANEQERIVKKVEELFRLCDLLEKQIDQSSKKQTQILDAVLAQL